MLRMEIAPRCGSAQNYDRLNVLSSERQRWPGGISLPAHLPHPLMNPRLLSCINLLLASWISGCASRSEQGYQSYLGRRAPQPVAEALNSNSVPPAFSALSEVSVREIHLSSQQPIDTATRIQLLSISGDQTTKILTQSGEILTGRPGDYFASPGLGASGLQLLSASSQQGDALFEQRLQR